MLTCEEAEPQRTPCWDWMNCVCTLFVFTVVHKSVIIAWNEVFSQETGSARRCNITEPSVEKRKMAFNLLRFLFFKVCWFPVRWLFLLNWCCFNKVLSYWFLFGFKGS